MAFLIKLVTVSNTIIVEAGTPQGTVSVPNDFKLMGGAADFKVGVQNRIRERSERKKNLYPTFQM